MWNYLSLKKLGGKNKMKKNNKSFSDYKKKELDYILCPIHNIRYPKGTSCPSCAAEKKKDK